MVVANPSNVTYVGKLFHEKWILSHHIKIVHDKISHRIQCSLCDKTFCRKNILSSHMKINTNMIFLNNLDNIFIQISKNRII